MSLSTLFLLKTKKENRSFKRGLLLSMGMLITMLFSFTLGRGQNVSATWGTNANTAWYTPGNWAGGAYAGVQGAAAANSNIATFSSAFTGTTAGINMGTNSLNLGAISIDNTRTTALNIGNSSATGGVLRLYGATVNSIANTIIRHNGTGLFTLQAAQNGTMGVVLGNTTENIISIDNTGGVTISSIISELVAGNKLTKAGTGTGILQLTGANTYTGLTTVNGGTLQLNRTGGTSIPVGNSVTVSNGGTLLISTAQTLNNVTVDAGGTLILANGITVSGTFTVNGTLQINSGGFTNTAPAYGSASNLKYNSGGTYGRGTEWSTTSGAGYPANVQISNNTTLTLGNGSTGTARQCSGNLTIDAGSTLTMAGAAVMTATLTVGGNVNLAGTLVLSTGSGGDIKVGGNWAFTVGGTFTSNTRAVFFTGGAQQTISRSAAGTLNFDYLLNQNTSGGLKLGTGTDINVNGGGNGLQLLGTGSGNSFDLNGRTLQLGTATNIQLSGSQTIISSAGTGILKVQTGGSNNINSGTALTTAAAVDVQLNAGMDFGSNLTTINGTLTINPGGFVNTNAPFYGTGSTLKYNSGSSYTRGKEWSNTANAGYPYHVQISNSTTMISGGAFGATFPAIAAGNLTIDAASTYTMNSGGGNMTLPTVINGSILLNGTLEASSSLGGDIRVRGDWTSTGTFTPNSRAVFIDGSAATQTITRSGGQSFDYLLIDKLAGGVSLANDITVNQTLTLSNGLITTGSNKVIISSTGSVSRTNSHVAGNLQKHIGTGSPSLTYEIGGASNYRPVSVSFNNVTGAGDLTASVSQAAGAHPNLATSTINNTLRLDRYFILTNSGTAFTSYDATFNYVSGDVINGADPLNFIAGKWNGSSWSYPTIGTKTSVSTQITGETSFSDFAFGELNATPTLNAGVLTSFGSICINTTAGPNTFTITGSALTNADVTVASLNGFTYSTDDITYLSSLSIAQPGGTFSQLIYVKFNPILGQSYDGNIVVGGAGASNINVAATGTGLNTAPTVTTAAATGVTAIAATIPGTITSIGCSAVTAYGVEYSTSNGFANGTGTPEAGSNLSGGDFSVGISGLSPATTYYYHAYATNGGGTGYSAQGSFTTVTPTLSGSALTSFGNVCSGLTAGPNTFTITGTNLSAANVTVAALNGFTYSTDDITYTASLSLPQPGGSFSQLIYVKFSPMLVQSYNGNIVLAGGGAANFNEAASGSGVSTVPSLTTGSSGGVTQVTATLNGTITADGCTAVTAYGVEYSTSNGFANGTGTPAVGSNLSGGNFSVAISGLGANTTYYYHAYATNAGGTGYGAQQSFTTSVLDAPVATAATAIASTSFTANWNAVTGATSYGLDVSTSNTFSGAGIVASEAFENPLTLFTATGTGAFYTGNSAAGERPPSSPFFSAGTSGYGVTNGTATLTSANINTTGGAASLSFKLASFSLSGSGNGADGGDIVTVEVSPNGGTSYFSTLRILGNANACWAFAATGSASTTYDGNATPVDFPASGGGLLAAGTSTITITGLPSATNVRIRITLLNDNVNERWVIDALNVNGTAGSFVTGYNNLSVPGTSQSVTGLTANTTYYYRVRAVSANSTSANSNTITAQTCQTAILGTTQNNVSCNGGNNGSIDLTVTGGTAPIAYSWTGPGGFTATTEDISGLAAGQYDVIVTSNTGCPATTSVTITEPAALSATLSGSATICEGGSANITVTISGGTAPYSVTYNDGINNHTVGSLIAGVNSIPVTPLIGANNYSLVSVTDNTSCTGSVSGTATITVNPNYTITASAGANGSISPDGITTLSCDGTGDQAYTITPDACYAIADVVVDGVSQGAVGTYTFTNVTANHTISATFTFNTYTITVTAGANGSITPATGSVNCGDNATYTITPDACYAITDVVVDGVSQGAVGTYTFTNVTANHTISATFSLNTYTITVTAGANGSITPATGSVNCGDNATYTITPDACYVINEVVVDGVSAGTVGTYTFTNVTTNHTISASFVLATYLITVTPGANGSITPATGSVNCGDNATYTITPNACYAIADVVVDGVSQGAVETYTFTNVTANHTISATFSLNTYTITVTAGANGSITPATGSVNCGDNATYTITPDACYVINEVVVDGVSAGTVGTYTFTNVTANHTISASFVLATYLITVTPGANGSITPSSGMKNCGDNATYTITPDACYAITDVVVDGVSQGAVGTYTFTNVTANHTISATFSLNTYTITVTAGANGSITPATGTVNCGDNATYTITADACYSITDVVVDGVSQGAVGTYTFTNVTANHTISATFTLNTYTITVTSGANGSITPATGSVNCGDNATYTITADGGYTIADVVVDGVSQGAVGTYTFTNVTANHTISATFVNNASFIITSSAGANGSISPNGATSVASGGSQAYTITAIACYHVADVLVDGVSVGAVTTYTFTNVTANHTISATFAINAPLSVSVSGPVNVCPYIGTGDQITYTATSVGATGFTWVIPPTNVTIISGQGTASLTVSFQNGFQSQANKQLRVTATSACGNSPLFVYYLVVQIPSTPQPIVGTTSVCAVIGTAGTLTYTIPSVPGASSYNWVAQLGTTTITHPNGLGVNDTTVNVSFTNGFTASSLTVSASNQGCGTSGVRSLALTRNNPSQPGLISGPTNACAYIAPGGTVAAYSIVPVAGASSYTWTVPAGAIGVSPQGSTSISFTYPNSFVSGTVSVTATNGCGTGAARTLSISRLTPSTPSVIDVIQTSPCPNRVYTYTLSGMPANATSVQWTIPAGATLVSGQGTVSITVSYPGTAVNGAVTAQGISNCGSSTIRSTTVKLPACPELKQAVYTKGGTTPATTRVAAESMQVNVFPNPTVSDFKLQVITAGKQVINVRIMDAQGRSIKQLLVMPSQTVNIGADLKAGAYIMEVRQGDNVKTTKLLKF